MNIHMRVGNGFPANAGWYWFPIWNIYHIEGILVRVDHEKEDEASDNLQKQKSFHTFDICIYFEEDAFGPSAALI